MIYDLLALAAVIATAIIAVGSVLWSMQNFDRRARNPCIKDVRRECSDNDCCQTQDAHERFDKFIDRLKDRG